jgi:hypothetical protein
MTQAAPQMERVYCRANHPEQNKGAQTLHCATLLGLVPQGWTFVGTSAAPPSDNAHDTRIWLKCSKRNCKTWNIFARVPKDG